VKILVADDDPINRRLLEAFLVKWNYEVVLACDGNEAWNILSQKDAPKLAILDWMMPGLDGTQICRRIRNRSGESYVYVLLLTAKFQKADIIEGLDAGADDYLAKPFDANELRARLWTGLRVLGLEKRLRSAYENLLFHAAHDSLTGGWNRVAILETLRTEVARAQRQGTALSVMMADLDHFKQVNDTYGHLTGDEVLRETAKRMQACVRSYDAVGRYGGEEFLIVMPLCDVSVAPSRAEELRAAISSTPMDTPKGAVPVTVSLGVAIGEGAMSMDVESLLRNADEALYQAKQAGRNRVVVYQIDQERLPASGEHPSADKILVEG
jgi:two-component system cell cycle response regulator